MVACRCGAALASKVYGGKFGPGVGALDARAKERVGTTREAAAAASRHQREHNRCEQGPE
jgi:hypothetical protein